MRSMTGYGRGEAERDGTRVVAEIRSVNHRFLDLKLRGHNLGLEIEDKLRSRVRKALSRGSVTLTVRVDTGESDRAVRIDLGAARRIHRSLRALADELGVDRPTGLDLVCAVPGVVSVDEAQPGESLAAAAIDAVDAALEALVGMRSHEGDVLAADLRARLERLIELAASLAEHARVAPDEARRRLTERIDRLLATSKVDVDPARLAQEVAVLADRLDVTEELVRVRAHADQLLELMETATGAVGRRLDFLVQELGREFNTVASKSQSADISSLVVEAKAELERLREQVQNIE
jgi:uncharacterized protein (TIGR00255 family)